MVFQNYALYPHMSVAENIAFGLSLRKIPKDQIRVKVAAAAEILGLGELLSHKPGLLSGASASAWRWAGRSCATRRSS